MKSKTKVFMFMVHIDFLGQTSRVRILWAKAHFDFISLGAQTIFLLQAYILQT